MRRRILQATENYKPSEENTLKPSTLRSYDQKMGWVLETSADGEQDRRANRGNSYMTGIGL